MGSGRAATIATLEKRPWEKKAMWGDDDSVDIDSPDRSVDRGGEDFDHFEGEGYYGGEQTDMYMFEKASDRQVEEPVQPFKNFGFGCSAEEHVKFGQCLDGKCCQRTHLERKTAKTFQTQQLRLAKDKRATGGSRGAIGGSGGGAVGGSRRKAKNGTKLIERVKTVMH